MITAEQALLIENLIDIKIRIALTQGVIANDPHVTQESVIQTMTPMHEAVESLVQRLTTS